MAILAHGSNRGVSTTAVALTSAALPNTYEIQIKAGAANTQAIYVGNDNTVTANSDGGTDGYQLAANAEMTVSASMAETTGDVWLIAPSGTQVAFWRIRNNVQQSSVGWALDFSTPVSSGYIAAF